MSNSRHNYRGFTLLEVLIAVAIMSVIAITLYASLYIAVKAKRSSIEAIEPYESVGAAFEYIRKDLTCVLKPGGNLAGDFVGTDQTGSDTLDCDTISMYTTSARTSDEQSGSNIIKVEYVFEEEETGEDDNSVLEDDELGQMVLKRNTTTNLLATTTAEPKSEVVARDITGINLRYYDGTDWVDQWDSTDNDDSLPQAVEVSLSMERKQTVVSSKDDMTVTYTKIFMLDCYKPQKESEQSQEDESQQQK